MVHTDTGTPPPQIRKPAQGPSALPSPIHAHQLHPFSILARLCFSPLFPGRRPPAFPHIHPPLAVLVGHLVTVQAGEPAIGLHALVMVGGDVVSGNKWKGVALMQRGAAGSPPSCCKRAFQAACSIATEVKTRRALPAADRKRH